MPITIVEMFESGRSTEGGQSAQSELIFKVTGTEDTDTIRALGSSLFPTDHADKKFQNFTLDHLGGGVWELVGKYGLVEPKKPGDSEYTFDTGGATQHITQALATRRYDLSEGQPGPDLKGAIGVNGDDVAGVDITLPAYQFTERHYVPAENVTGAYKSALFYATGTTNNATFKGFARGEVLFLGASGAQRGAEDWEITFRFAASPNVADLNIAGIAVALKRGWEYLWVKYADADDGTWLTKEAVAVYVEQVYPESNFASLGIGT